MRVLVMVKATKESEAGIQAGDPGFDRMVEEMGKFQRGARKGRCVTGGRWPSPKQQRQARPLLRLRRDANRH
jgi:hypothetical protein